MPECNNNNKHTDYCTCLQKRQRCAASHISTHSAAEYATRSNQNLASKAKVQALLRFITQEVNYTRGDKKLQNLLKQ